MDTTKLLDDIRIASPCKALWSEMAGDERVRFCQLCKKHVYNISGMSSVEATALIERTQGRLCARLYRRRDGTVLTTDCAVGVQAAARGRLRRLATWAAMGLAVFFTSKLLRTYGQATGWDPVSPSPSGCTIALEDWVDWVRDLFGWRSAARPTPSVTVTMGGMCAPLPPSNNSGAQ